MGDVNQQGPVRQPLTRRLGDDDRLGDRVPDEIVQALARIRWIEWNVGRARSRDGDEGDDHGSGSRYADPDSLLGPADPGLLQGAGEGLRARIELAICHLTVVGVNGHPLRVKAQRPVE